MQSFDAAFDSFGSACARQQPLTEFLDPVVSQTGCDRAELRPAAGKDHVFDLPAEPHLCADDTSGIALEWVV